MREHEQILDLVRNQIPLSLKRRNFISINRGVLIEGLEQRRDIVENLFKSALVIEVSLAEIAQRRKRIDQGLLTAR